MSVEQMRDILKHQYGGSDKWTSRVDVMSDTQVQAVYFRMLRDGKLGRT